MIELLQEASNKNLLKELINNENCKIFGGNKAFIKWKITSQNYEDIMDIITLLMNQRNSYRIVIMNEGQIQIFSDNDIKYEYVNLPMPVLKYEFDDELTIKSLTEMEV